jgi:hypothetical protein
VIFYTTRINSNKLIKNILFSYVKSATNFLCFLSLKIKLRSHIRWKSTKYKFNEDVCRVASYKRFWEIGYYHFFIELVYEVSNKNKTLL